MKPIEKGIWPVMVTPFNADGSIAWPVIDELVDYYIAQGVAGLFPVCTSGEFLELTNDERINIATQVVQRAAGKIGVVATGNFGLTIDEQVEMIKKTSDTGVTATVVATSLLPHADALVDDYLRIVEKTNNDLGIYEAPIPTHRTLTVNQMDSLAQTNRFFFCKETSKNINAFQGKVQGANGTCLNIFQANLNSFFKTAMNYGSGFSGCVANITPYLLSQYLKTLTPNDSQWHQQVRHVITEIESITQINGYPASTKYFLSRAGLSIQPHCRVEKTKTFHTHQQRAIDQCIEMVQEYFTPDPSGWRSLRIPN